MSYEDDNRSPYEDAILESSGDRSEITDKTLWNYNVGAGVLHAVQGMMMLIVSQVVPNIKAFSKDLTTSYLEYDKATKALVSRTQTVTSIEIGVIAAVFLLLSALAHGYVVLRWDTYMQDIARETNRARWYEYALSSSVMICGIAMLFGCYDIQTLLLMFVVNACMNFFGLLMERMNPPDRVEVDWTPFVFGCVSAPIPM